jgi:hypothetical protein
LSKSQSPYPTGAVLSAPADRASHGLVPLQGLPFADSTVGFCMWGATPKDLASTPLTLDSHGLSHTADCPRASIRVPALQSFKELQSRACSFEPTRPSWGLCPPELARRSLHHSSRPPHAALCAPTENERPRLPKQSGPSNSVGKRGMRCVPLRRISFKHRLLLTSPSRADPLIALARPSERPPCAYRPYRLNDSAVTFRLSAPAFAVLSAEPSRALIQELITWLSWPSRRVQSV